MGRARTVEANSLSDPDAQPTNSLQTLLHANVCTTPLVRKGLVVLSPAPLGPDMTGARRPRTQVH